MGSNARAIADEIERQYNAAADGGEFDGDVDTFMADEVAPVWKEYYAPVLTGDYKASIEITERAKAGVGRLSATDEAANVIEYGSNDTPEFAPREKTIDHFGGTRGKRGGRRKK